MHNKTTLTYFKTS